jgi:hypothetical protein
MGAFLQQAAPMAMQYPDMRGLLGGIMMFTLRTFSASRPLEKTFEQFQQTLAAMPPTPPPDQKDNGQATAQIQAQASLQAAQIKAQTEQQNAQLDAQSKKYEVDAKSSTEQLKSNSEHAYRMAQLQMEGHKLGLEKTKVGLNTMAEERQHVVDQQAAGRTDAQASMDQAGNFNLQAADQQINFQNALMKNQMEHRRLDIMQQQQEAQAEKQEQQDEGGQE